MSIWREGDAPGLLWLEPKCLIFRVGGGEEERKIPIVNIENNCQHTLLI